MTNLERLIPMQQVVNDLKDYENLTPLQEVAKLNLEVAIAALELDNQVMNNETPTNIYDVQPSS